MNVTLFGKKKFVGVIKRRISKLGHHGLKRALNPISVLKREGMKTEEEEEEMRTEAEAAVKNGQEKEF